MLRDDYPKLNLKTGDRLEPCASLQDVGAFEDISSFPCQVLFWRASLATMATRRNPIFGEQTGCSTKCIAIDILHCLYLGVMQRIVSELLWRLLDVNAWRVQGSVVNKHSLSMNRLRHDLANFYEARSKEARRGEGDGEELTEVTDFQEKHLGTSQKHALKLKAAETWGVFRFMPSLLAERGAALGRERVLWERAISAFIEHMEVMRTSGRSMSASALQKLVDTFHTVIGCLKAMPYEFPWSPKFHLWAHLLQQSFLIGNPKFGSTFLDESFNGSLKRTARGVFGGRTFEVRLFWRVNQVMRRLATLRRTKRQRW